jgi:predicted lipid-binding transport protein (Tim44 family)
MTHMLDPLNIILLVVAVLVLWKLKSVLGQRTGLEKRPSDLAPVPQERDNVIRLPGVQAKPEAEPKLAEPVWTGHAEAGTPAALGLEQIATASRNFTVPSFLSGSAMAYEMVLEAFAKGDRSALKLLLGKDVMDGFSTAIDQRQKSGQTMNLQFVGMKSSKIEDARLEGSKAQITVRFAAEMINAVIDKDGNTIDGESKQVRDVFDTWTFERDVTARDPNWKLVDTGDDTA